MVNHKIEISFCHRKPERSFFWKGKQFPVCARCTGILIGYLSCPLFLFNFISLNLLVSFLLILPSLSDGLMQMFMSRESNNSFRVVSGLFAGIGLMSMAIKTGDLIGSGLLFVVKLF